MKSHVNSRCDTHHLTRLSVTRSRSTLSIYSLLSSLLFSFLSHQLKHTSPSVLFVVYVHVWYFSLLSFTLQSFSHFTHSCVTSHSLTFRSFCVCVSLSSCTRCCICWACRRPKVAIASHVYVRVRVCELKSKREMRASQSESIFNLSSNNFSR